MRERDSRGDVVLERRVAAGPEVVFRYFTDEQRWMRWQGVDAHIELRRGGVFRVNVTGDGFASGRFTEVIENRRIIFTWGWERADSPIPPGSSTVVIDLVPTDGGTLIRLTHSGLPQEAVDEHRAGWENYVSRLADVTDGREPGPDPLRVAQA